MQSSTQRRMCGFDGRCTNPRCTYVHVVQKPTREVCRFGEKCNNVKCWRFHCMCKVVAQPVSVPKVTMSVGLDDALMLRMIETMRLRGATTKAEAEMLRMYETCVKAVSVDMGMGLTDDDEVDKAFGEFLDGTDKEAILDDYAAQQLDDYEGEDEDDFDEYEDPMTAY